VVGTLCSYAPEEILLAAGVLGYRIFGTGAPVSMADLHLQSYGCSLVRGALEENLSGRLEFLDGVIFPHTCDSIMRLSDIWRMNLKSGFHMDLVLPVKLNTRSALDYMADLFASFRKDLERTLGREIPDQEIQGAALVLNRIRKAAARIYALRERTPWAVSGGEIHAMARAAMVMDRREFMTRIEAAADALESESPPARDGKRLFLSGGLCTLPDLFDVIQEAGAWIVGDDLCTGSRYFDGLTDGVGNPMEAMARRYAGRVICPAKHSGIRARGEHLVRRVRESGARGVIFLFLKFCDPHGFDYPYLKTLLEAEGVPCLLQELEDTRDGGGQIRTRIEAFVEML
jgi:bcr-type benzoyl-CoA reductase subunit C